LNSCPVCKDVPSFVPEMENFGIYVPSDSTDHPKVKCSAHVCICQERQQDHRSYNEENTLWEIIECHICAKVGIHAKCGGLVIISTLFKLSHNQFKSTLSCKNCKSSFTHKKIHLDLLTKCSETSQSITFHDNKFPFQIDSMNFWIHTGIVTNAAE
jgi:hypothetical protein